MPAELADIARRMTAALESTDLTAIRADLSDRLDGWDPGPWINERWQPRLDELAGPDRSVTGAYRISDVMARITFAGDHGQAFVSVLFDGTARVAGLAIDPDERDARFAVVVGCTPEQRDELHAFYAMLTRGPIGFGEGGARAPRWRDPDHPTQLHFDVEVADLEAAEQAVLEHGALKLEDGAGWRVYADPVGHPFCLYPGLTDPTDTLGKLARVVIDCPDPSELARFWGGVLEMPRRVEESTDRIVIAREHPDLPMIALQRVADYRPPRWPGAKHPAQMHFDLGFDDRPRKEQLALVLGATLLPPQGSSCPVYADPAGHPFCLCYKGE